ncbi:MAG: hypothetical protein Q9217_004260 [Psora testacea]
MAPLRIEKNVRTPYELAGIHTAKQMTPQKKKQQYDIIFSDKLSIKDLLVRLHKIVAISDQECRNRVNKEYKHRADAQRPLKFNLAQHSVCSEAHSKPTNTGSGSAYAVRNASLFCEPLRYHGQ